MKNKKHLLLIPVLLITVFLSSCSLVDVARPKTCNRGYFLEDDVCVPAKRQLKGKDASTIVKSWYVALTHTTPDECVDLNIVTDDCEALKTSLKNSGLGQGDLYYYDYEGDLESFTLTVYKRGEYGKYVISSDYAKNENNKYVFTNLTYEDVDYTAFTEAEIDTIINDYFFDDNYLRTCDDNVLTTHTDSDCDWFVHYGWYDHLDEIKEIRIDDEMNYLTVILGNQADDTVEMRLSLYIFRTDDGYKLSDVTIMNFSDLYLSKDEVKTFFENTIGETVTQASIDNLNLLTPEHIPNSLVSTALAPLLNKDITIEVHGNTLVDFRVYIDEVDGLYSTMFSVTIKDDQFFITRIENMELMDYFDFNISKQAMIDFADDFYQDYENGSLDCSEIMISTNPNNFTCTAPEIESQASTYEIVEYKRDGGNMLLVKRLNEDGNIIAYDNFVFAIENDELKLGGFFFSDFELPDLDIAKTTVEALFTAYDAEDFDGLCELIEANPDLDESFDCSAHLGTLHDNSTTFKVLEVTRPDVTESNNVVSVKIEQKNTTETVVFTVNLYITDLESNPYTYLISSYQSEPTD